MLRGAMPQARQEAAMLGTLAKSISRGWSVLGRPPAWFDFKTHQITCGSASRSAAEGPLGKVLHAFVPTSPDVSPEQPAKHVWAGMLTGMP